MADETALIQTVISDAAVRDLPPDDIACFPSISSHEEDANTVHMVGEVSRHHWNIALVFGSHCASETAIQK